MPNLEALEPEMREGGIVYKCLPGQHDDLGISLRDAELGGSSSAFGLLDGQHDGGPPAAPPPTTKNQLGRLDVTSLEDDALLLAPPTSSAAAAPPDSYGPGTA